MQGFCIILHSCQGSCNRPAEILVIYVWNEGGNAQNLRKSEPVRSFKDNWSLKKVGKVKDEYKKLDDFLKNVATYTAKDLIDFEPEDKTERRKWYDNLYLSFDISLFTYRYGNYLGNVNLV